MKNILILIMLFAGIQHWSSQPSADSTELKANMLKLNKKLSHIKQLINEVEKVEQERLNVYQRLKSYFFVKEKKQSRPVHPDLKIDSFLGLRPDHFQSLNISEKYKIEQRPKTFFGRLWSREKYRYFINDSIEIKRIR